MQANLMAFDRIFFEFDLSYELKLLVYVLLTVLLGLVITVIVYAIYKFSFKETTFEEVVELQRKQNLEEEIKQKLEKSKKEKKKIKWNKKSKKKVEVSDAKKDIEFQDDVFQGETVILSNDISSDIISSPEETNHSKKVNIPDHQLKDVKTKTNNTFLENNKSPLMKEKEAFNDSNKIIEDALPLDMETKNPIKSNISDHQLKNEKTKDNITCLENNKSSPIKDVEEKVFVNDSNKIIEDELAHDMDSKQKKRRRRKKSQDNDELINVTASKLLTLLKNAELDAEENQMLIDILLNKQKDSALWQTPNDPIAILKKNLQEKELKLAELTKRCLQEREEFKETLSKTKSNVISLEKANQEKMFSLSKEVEIITEKLKKSELELTNAREKYIKMENSFDEKVQQAKKEYHDQNLHNHLAIKTLEEQKFALEDQVKMLQEVKFVMENKIEVQHEQNNEMTQTIEKLSNENSMLQLKVNDIHSKASLLTSKKKIFGLQKSLEALKNIYYNLAQHIHSLNQTQMLNVDKVSEYLICLKSQFDDINKNYIQQCEKIAKLEKLNTSLENTCQSLNEQMNNVKQCQISQEQESMQKFQDEIKSKEHEHENILKELKSQLQQATALNNMLTTEKDILIKEKENLIITKNALESKILCLKDEQEKTNTILLQKNVDIDALKAKWIEELNQKEKELEDALSEKITLITEKDILIADKLSLTSKIQALKEENDSLLTAKEEFNKENSVIITEKEALKVEKDSLLAEKQNLLAEIESLNSSLQQLNHFEEVQEKLLLFQNNLEACEKENSHFQLKYDEVHKNYINLKDQLENKEKLISDLQQDKTNTAKLIKENAELQKHLNNELKLNKEYSSQMVKLNSLIKIGQDSLAAEQEINKNLRNQLEAAQNSSKQ